MLSYIKAQIHNNALLMSLMLNKKNELLLTNMNIYSMKFNLSEDLEDSINELIKRICQSNKEVKISSSEIIRTAVKYLCDLDIDPAGIKNEEDLLDKMHEAVKKR